MRIEADRLNTANPLGDFHVVRGPPWNLFLKKVKRKPTETPQIQVVAPENNING